MRSGSIELTAGVRDPIKVEFAELEADQCVELYNGGRDIAFFWTHLEKRRKMVNLGVK